MTELLYQGKFLRLLRAGRWEYVERSGATGAAVIVALTAEGKLLLTEQYRIPLACRVIELPAGLAGDIPGEEGEPLSNAARRELLEETGYAAETFLRLASGPTTAGLSSEENTLFLATGLRKIGAGGGDGHENIQVHEVPLAGLPAWLEEKERQGLRIDLKVYAGLYLLDQQPRDKRVQS